MRSGTTYVTIQFTFAVTLTESLFFCNPSLRVAEVDHFAIHTFEFNGAIYTHAFAIVKWLLPHVSCNLIGKPYLICCNFVYESIVFCLLKTFHLFYLLLKTLIWMTLLLLLYQLRTNNIIMWNVFIKISNK